MNKILIGLFLTAFTFVANAATIENKTSQFDEILTDISDASADTAKSALAEQVRAQRAALDAASDSDAMSKRSTTTSGGNSCDKNLRACMQEKCGKDYSKCAGDTDTLWGTKMESCRRNVTCTGEEYKLFTTEIKADRDLNAKLASYNAIIECGNQYNNCIITECGPKFNKCLGKAAGDTAISKCEKIAKSCTEQDNGLASRTMNVFGTLRGNAEKQVQRDQERLYELREKMSSVCSRLGAMLDERSFDCVYSVNFYADSGSTLYASKKAYAGSTFSCNQNWFGIDITTFKENAYRLTQEQTSASSAMMGAGLGVGAGALTSGALDRAMDRAKADRALNSELCESTGGKWNKTTNLCNCGKKSKFDKEAGCVAKGDKSDDTDSEQQQQPEPEEEEATENQGKSEKTVSEEANKTTTNNSGSNGGTGGTTSSTNPCSEEEDNVPCNNPHNGICRNKQCVCDETKHMMKIGSVCDTMERTANGKCPDGWTCKDYENNKKICQKN